MLKDVIFSKKGALAAFAITALVFLLRPLFIGAAWAPFDFHEHFYNTLAIIGNFRTYGMPIFDTADLTLRNATTDFSPVYAALLYLITAVVSTKTVLFFIIIRFLAILCAVASLFLLNGLIKKLAAATPTRSELFFLNALFIALFSRDACAATGSFLVIPALLFTAKLMLDVLEHPSVTQGIRLGACFTVCFLIQPDSTGYFLTFALVFYFQFNGKTPVSYRAFFKLLAGFVAGLLPLAALLAKLYLKYDLSLPSTYTTWQSVQDTRPWNLFLLFFWYPVRYFLRMPTQLVFMTFPFALCILAASVSFPEDVKKTTARHTVFWTLVWYPIVWFSVLAFFTYVDLPVYAFYPLAIGTPFALLFVVQKIRSNQTGLENEQRLLDRYCLLMAGVCFLMAFLQIATPFSRAYKPLIEATTDTVTTVPAVYAMGKGAGLVLYATQQLPLLRIDGYAATKATAAALKHSDSLAHFLKQRRADFYIGVNIKRTDGCATAREPANTLFGPTNRAMTAWICADPLIEKKLSNGLTFSVFRVDDLQSAVK